MTTDKKWLVKVERTNFFKCGRCPQVFTDASRLETHFDSHRNHFKTHASSAYVKLEKTPIFSCDRCRQSFLCKRKLLVHKFKHVQTVVNLKKINNRYGHNNNTLKPYKCPECEYSFKLKETLEEHSILHKPLPSICFCGVRFYQKLDLQYHKKIVHPSITKDKENINKQKNQDQIENKKRSSNKPTLKDLFRSKTVKVKRGQGLPKPDIKIETVGNKFKCPVCKKLMSSKAGFYIHYRTHTGEKPYSCDICGKGFNQPGALKIHKYIHETENNFRCETCGKAFKSPVFLTRHKQIHLNLRQYVCKYCGKGFNDKSACSCHERIHTGDKRYRCPHCPKAYTDSSALGRHKRRHSKKKLSCEICNKKFYDKHQLEGHIKRIHKNEKTFCCHYCKKWFTMKINLASHIMRIHLNQFGKVQCQYCGKSVDKNKLNLHILQHKNMVRFKCEVCIRGFYLPRAYRRHIKSHGQVGSQVYTCDHCQKTFMFKGLLYSHILTHLGTKCQHCKHNFANKHDLAEHQFKKEECCEICGMQYICRTQVFSHVRRHLPPKKLKCGDCDETFVKKSALLEHCNSNHLGKYYQCDICKKKIFSKTKLSSHIVEHHFKRYQCKECSKIFFWESEYKKHKEIEASLLVTYNCNFCENYFTSKDSYQNHLRKQHGVDKFACEICDKEYTHKTSLRRHVANAHGYRNIFLDQLSSVLSSVS